MAISVSKLSRELLLRTHMNLIYAKTYPSLIESTNDSESTAVPRLFSSTTIGICIELYSTVNISSENVLYVATTATTTTTAYGASTCNGSYTNYSNDTTCGHICQDVESSIRQSTSTYCTNDTFAYSGINSLIP